MVGTWLHSELHKGNAIYLLQTSVGYDKYFIFDFYKMLYFHNIARINVKRKYKNENNQIVLLKILKHNI